MKFCSVSLGDLLDRFGGECIANAEQPTPADGPELTGFAPLESAQTGHLSFLSNLKLRKTLLTTQASVVLVPQKHAQACADLLSEALKQKMPILWAVADPYLYYAKIQQWWVKASEPQASAGVHSSAVVHENAQVAADAVIGPNAVIEADAVISSGVQIGPGSVVGRATQIGANTRLHANVTAYHECIIGRDCIIHSGAVIGADGFGFANEGGAWVKIPQTGRVVLADDVEVGANTTIDRGALEDTLIGFGVKLDNQIMIAHNTTIGEHTAMAGCVGVAGSTHIGARCTIGGAAMLLGHLSLPDGTHISGASAVMSSIKEPGAYSGIFPIDKHKSWERTAATLKQLTELRQRIRALEKNIS